MVLQIFGIPLSVSVRHSLVALKELDVPYALVTVDVTKGEQKSEETLKHQPFSQIPYIHDSENDLTLFESRAIARYVVNKYDKEGKSGLIPKDEVANAKFEQAASIELTKFDPVVSAIATELVFKPVLWKTQGDQAVADKHLESLSKVLDVYEGILTKQKYLAGDSVTLADLFHLPLGTLLTDLAKLDVLTTEKRPNVLRWWTDISTRPTWAVIKADMAPLA